MIEEINATITKNEIVCDSLVGRFISLTNTSEYVIQYDYFPSCDHQSRDVCLLEKQDCTVSSDQENQEPKCREFGRNRKCEQFEWSLIELGTEKTAGCLALSINTNTTHDVNLCETYAATRIRFEKSNDRHNDKLFDEMVKIVKGKVCIYFLLTPSIKSLIYILIYK